MSVNRTLLALSMLLGVAARAQKPGEARLDVVSGASVGTSGSWHRETNAGLALGVSGASTFAFFEGQLRERDGRSALRLARAEGAWQSRPVGALRLSLSGALGTAPATDIHAPTLDVRANVSLRLGSGGMWLGGGGSEQGGLTALAGVWRAFGRALITLSVEPGRVRSSRDTVRLRQVPGVDSTWTDTAGWHVYPVTFTRADTVTGAVSAARPALQLRGDWASGRWTVSASAVRRMLVDFAPVTTAQLSVASRISGSIGLVASAGTSSHPTASDGEPTRFVAVGVRLWSSSLQRPPAAAVRPVATAFAVTHAAAGAYRITLCVPGARTAEVSGDFNQWMPVPLQETSPNTWELTLPMSPGAHRINVRINGDRWTAPPGVPTVDDEFNGRVGIVIVR